MRKGTKAAVVGALAVACAPVVAEATVLFTDNFDTAASATRYDQFIFDRANTATSDASATFNFNYGAFTYYHISADENNQNEGTLIPSAPRTVGGTTVGLRMDVNQIDTSPTSVDNPDTVVINLYPKLAEYVGSVLPSGDHKMTVDVFIDYNGREFGGGGSTEHAAMGINQSGGGTSAGSPVTPPGPATSGQGFTVNGERGNSFDYRFWNGSTRIGSTDALGAEVGYVAVDGGTGQPGPADGENTYYQNAFPRVNPNNAAESWYETSGGMGKHWTTIEMKYEDGIVYTYATPAGSTNPPVLIAARTEESPSSGHVMLGYADFNNNKAANDPTSLDDANFVIYDNLVVETVTQTRQKWNVNTGGNWTDATKWLSNDDADGITEVADFTTALGASQVVTVDSPRTVRSITFDSGNPATGYTLSGGNTISLDSITTGVRTKVKATSGTHNISATLQTNRPITFDIAANSSVKVDNLVVDITVPAGHFEAPNAILKQGAGTAEVNNIRLADEDGLASTIPNARITAGTLKVTPQADPYDVSSEAGTGKVGSLNITGGKLDITNTKIITQNADFTGVTYDGDNDIYVYNGITGLVAQGRGDSTWNGTTGITTSETDATVAGLTGIAVSTGAKLRFLGPTDTEVFAGQTINGNSTIVMYTYSGDTDMDGDLDGDDYFAIDNNILASQSAPGNLNFIGWEKGDVNYDGKVTGDDYFYIDNYISQGSQATGDIFWVRAPEFAGGGMSAVPEPATLGLLGIGAIGSLRRRRP